MSGNVPKPFPLDASLILIDLQNAIDYPSWGQRNNRETERNIASLLRVWRASSRPVYHIRHDSSEPTSPYRPGQAGNQFKLEAQPVPGEIIISKKTNSAFIGTNLEPMLRATNQSLLVIAGVITNNSVEATVRMAGNLGFDGCVANRDGERSGCESCLWLSNTEDNLDEPDLRGEIVL
ncbi:MAG: isochorismatase family protein [Bryobacteraceae bacterium]